MVPESGSMNKVRSVGLYLRESRESRGIELEDAARVTRIGRNYLTALEEDRYHALPNPAYVRGFLRAYAVFLHLSGDDIIAMFERTASLSADEPCESTERRSGPKAESFNKPRQGRWIIPLGLFTLVIGAALLSRDKTPRMDSAPSANLVMSAPAGPMAVQLARSSAAKPPDASVVATDKVPGDLGPNSAENHHGGIILRLKVNQESSLIITIDGLVTQQYDLKAGDLIEWKADRMIALDMGNGGGMEAEMNGKPLKPFAEPGKPAHVVLKADTP